MNNTQAVALVGEQAGPDGEAMIRHLAALGLRGAAWFSPARLHELDRRVRQGEIHTVVFAAVPDLLLGIWEEEIAYDDWPAEVTIEFVRPAAGDALGTVAASWREWRARHRRRQAVAGAILSALMLAAAFVLCVLLAR